MASGQGNAQTHQRRLEVERSHNGIRLVRSTEDSVGTVRHAWTSFIHDEFKHHAESPCSEDQGKSRVSLLVLETIRNSVCGAR